MDAWAKLGMAVGYRMWLYGPVLVLGSLFVGRSVEHKQGDEVEPWKSNIDSVVRIPLMMGGVMPIGQIVSVIAGIALILHRRSTSWTNWAFFLASQTYMLMPYLVVLKTSYGVEIGMPLCALALIALILRFSHESLLRNRLENTLVKLYICAGIAIVTAGFIMLFSWIADVGPYRIIAALCVAIVGAVAIEIGVYKGRKYDKEKEPLLGSEPVTA